MSDARPLHQPPLLTQHGQAPPAHFAGHLQVVGHGDQQGPLIGVARAGERIDLEYRPARMIGVDRVAVVHHAFEHREGPDPHVPSLAAEWQPMGDDGEIDVSHMGRELVAAVDAALVPWLVSCVTSRSAGLQAAAEQAGEVARSHVVPRLAELLDRDIDDQATTPLAILRAAVAHPTAVLRSAGVPPAPRDRHAIEQFPDDTYDLVPASFADLGPAVAEAGLRWGAAKAFEHKRRHRG